MINGTSINIIQVYAPTEASTEEDIIEFYNLLDETINNCKAHRTFVMGDFNSKIGHRDYGEEEVMSIKISHRLGTLITLQNILYYNK